MPTKKNTKSRKSQKKAAPSLSDLMQPIPTSASSNHKPAAKPEILLRSVRQNNLKGFDLALPLGKLIVVTGLSGAGKSSLVFETLHAEGQRRYVETFSPYVRQFMEMMERPKVDSIENIRPSIAIQQSNTVKTSRSTVGTMTELCDYMKVWFCHRSRLFDPDTDQLVEDDNPQSIWQKAFASFTGQSVVLAFALTKPANFSWHEVIGNLKAKGFTRAFIHTAKAAPRRASLESVNAEQIPEDATLLIIQDRVTLSADAESRFIEAATACLHFGQGELRLLDEHGHELGHYSEGLHSPKSGRRFRASSPALFSFNSPLGACPKCRGFGRIIEIDFRLVIPDASLSIDAGAIRAFQGEVYSESQRDLLRACRKHRIPTNIPWRDMPEEHRQFVIEGEPDYDEDGKGWPNYWYGIRRFFTWLESTAYKMHVRVFLSKYRAYVPCPDCRGQRLQPEALYWKWNGHTLPDLYRLPISHLLELMTDELHAVTASPEYQQGASHTNPLLLSLEAIVTRLRYLEQVGLGYLNLDRSSRSLSGGETMRVSLTACLGTALVDTLFVLDEPSIGLHSRDTERLIGILRRLTDAGNTVVVVEHDESIMRAADYIIEIGPEPGTNGGHVVFAGTPQEILRMPDSLTGTYLSGAKTIPVPSRRRPVKPASPWLRITEATRHNLQKFSAKIPLQRLVVLSGVSGAGKSTLLDNVIHQGLLAKAGRSVEEPADIRSIETDLAFSEIVMVDQSPVSKTPRSNPALYAEAWDPIRDLLAGTDSARQAGLTAAHFSFNSGSGRCPTCEGLGHERIEMQFMADVYVPCPICEGKRFKSEILELKWRDLSVADVLDLNVRQALTLFSDQPKIKSRLESLVDVGLGYLPLGQPLNTLSGGESQRLKLVKYLSKVGESAHHALLLLDEPTTGLHRDDVSRLLQVLHRLVDSGHSLILIEHQLDIIKSADWVLELGPEAGINGGKLVFEGPPDALAQTDTETSPFLAAELAPRNTLAYQAPAADTSLSLLAAEDSSIDNSFIHVYGARQHNLQDVSLKIAHNQITVLTGVSGSGKSSLAFDIIFSEGQRRFMESMSAWARQYVEQLPRAEVDRLEGIPPTVAIEQRITAGTSKSTVATITEVAQYLRLLYARLGVQHSIVNGQPLVAQKPEALLARLSKILSETATASKRKSKQSDAYYLCSPIVRGRKGHHEPVAKWAEKQGYKILRIDGKIVPVSSFTKLDRFKEHDIEVVSWEIPLSAIPTSQDLPALEAALTLGNGTALLTSADGKAIAWLSTSRTDPVTGESYPELDPKHFSWNSAKGWCPKCHGYGLLESWMRSDEKFNLANVVFTDGELCPDCHGARLNPISRAVRLHLDDGRVFSLPELLALTPQALLDTLSQLRHDARSAAILRDLLPEIEERLRFMGQVGLDYLSLDRPTATLSGGEAQRIRLAAQLGSNLSGVLYVLDEPSIGLHARDNERLLQSLRDLRAKGNTLLIVEHDDDTMKLADHIVDLGPGAGINGGQIVAQGHWQELIHHPESITGRYLGKGIPHPLLGQRRPLAGLPNDAFRISPEDPSAKPKKSKRPSKNKRPSSGNGSITFSDLTSSQDWITLQGASLRNLKDFDVALPIGRLTVVCGISGAGKSTLIRDLLTPLVSYASKHSHSHLDWKHVANCPDLPFRNSPAPVFRSLTNAHQFRSVVEVDQTPIGKTPRSTPATYIGIFDLIRQFFAELPEAKIAGHTASVFSFNTSGGRCDKCSGGGQIKLEMAFMPDTYVRCDECNGQRYSPILKDIRWKGKNIAEVLELSFDEARHFFDFHSRLSEVISLMCETGLGYLTLGQSSPTLSGGEAQRLKLVSELVHGLPTWKERTRGLPPKNLYILEEPTIGLHLSDCEKLIRLLHRLVDQGHTVIVIEHHLDVIAEADYLLEIGPQGGHLGGHLIYQGPPASLPSTPNSPTAPFLNGKV